VSKGSTIVLRGEMSRGLYKFIGNMQVSGAARRVSASNSSGRQVVRRKRVMFASSTEKDDDFGGSRQVEPSVLIFIKVEIGGIDKNQWKQKKEIKREVKEFLIIERTFQNLIFMEV